MKLAVAGIVLILLTSCATRPTMLDNAQAIHYSRMQEYAAIQDPQKRARMENLENARWSQFLAGMQSVAEQSARMQMYDAQTEAARAQAAALNAQRSNWQTPLGTYGNPVYVQPTQSTVTFTPAPIPPLSGNGFAPQPIYVPQY